LTKHWQNIISEQYLFFDNINENYFVEQLDRINRHGGEETLETLEPRPQHQTGDPPNSLPNMLGKGKRSKVDKLLGTTNLSPREETRDKSTSALGHSANSANSVNSAANSAAVQPVQLQRSVSTGGSGQNRATIGDGT
jgi:hypothetical protein